MKNETEPKALTQKELDKITDGWITRNTGKRKYDCATNFHRLGNVNNTSSKDQSENALSYKNRDESSMNTIPLYPATSREDTII